MTPSMDVSEKTCPCGKSYDSPFTKCPDCLSASCAPATEAAEAIKKQEARSKLVNAWTALCPASYRHTDWTRPGLSPVCQYHAKTWWPDWKAEANGLCLRGTSGLGKTRAMFDILRRLHFAGIGVAHVDATAFAAAVSNRYDDHHQTKWDARNLITRCHNVRILLFDDLGKEPATRAVASALHDLLDVRVRERRPLLWTTERTGADIANYLGDHYADGIVRRLRGASQIFDVSLPLPETPTIPNP